MANQSESDRERFTRDEFTDHAVWHPRGYQARALP